MTIAIDTNVLVALWEEGDALNVRAQAALDAAYDQGTLVISGVVYAELLSWPGRTEEILSDFLAQTGVKVDWPIDEAVWREAAKGYRSYSQRRRKQRQNQPRGLLTDFLIGAHAYDREFALLTLDDRIFRPAFPHLKLIGIS